MSPAAKLCGFLLLLGVVFAGAFAAGAHQGPVAPSHYQQGNPPTMNMNTGAPAGGHR